MQGVWRFLMLVLVLVMATPVIAQTPSAFGDALLMDRTLDIMQREAVQSSAEMAEDMFPGQRPVIWTNIVRDLFDPRLARLRFDQELRAAEINSDTLTQAQLFFSSDLGQRILELELSAREAMLDPAIKEAAKQAWATAQMATLPADTIRLARLSDVVIANDLIESNVMAALNSNLAYYQGLASSGAMDMGLSQSDMLAEVWAQESDLRRETEDWLYPFLNLAYQPLSIADLDAYIAFSNSAAGRAINAALFAAFDVLGKDQSRGMGLAAGKLMAGQDI